MVQFRPALLLGAVLGAHAAQDPSPLQKVISMLTDLHAKVVKEGEDAHATYKEFSDWCQERSQNLDYEIKTGKTQIADLKATIGKSTSAISALSAEIEETSGAISLNEADLKAAIKIRKTEEADFAASEKEMIEVVGALERAIAVLEREAAKGTAAMLQVQHAGNLVQALKVMIDAAMLGQQDASTLTALVQNDQAEKDSDSDDMFAPPEATAYTSKSGGIIDTLESLLEKAKEELESARKKETNSRHNFEMLQQSLNDEIKYGEEDMDKAKKNLALQKETQAAANGDLSMTTKSLAEDEKTKGTLKQDCMNKAQDYEAETKSRGEEVKAILEAKRVISEMTSGAAEVTYSFRQTSFLQLIGADANSRRASRSWTSVDLANYEAVRFVRRLAQKEHSEELAFLARRMAAAMRADSTDGEDPFKKVKNMIQEMINQLMKDAQAEATHKAYCDKELGDTVSKKNSKEAEIEKLSTKIDSMEANSARLKEEVTSLQKQLAELTSSQAESTQLRQKEKALFEKNEPEMKAGLQGVKMALKILREFYAQEGKSQGGAAGGVIGMLEVVEGDFAKTLAEMTAAEASAQADYDRESQESKIQQATKEQSVKYKTKEFKQLDMYLVDANSDRQGVQAELTAILEYNKHLLDSCVAKPESYSQRKERRDAEIAGLKEALSILEGEAAALLQGHVSSRWHTRGLRGRHA